MYKHTQIGWLMIVIAVIVVGMLLLIRFTTISIQAIDSLFVGIGITVVILFLFSSLTVSVDHEAVRFYLGPGLIRRKIPLRDIAACAVQRNKWWWGWGIHGTPGKGWLYNVSGFDSVQLTMKSGLKYLIGTDEPQKLCEAIQKALSSREV